MWFLVIFYLIFSRCIFIFLIVDVLGAEQRRQINMDNDEEIFQFAVQQSLLETGAEEDQVSFYLYVYL